jgi:hypothetical protein
MSTQTPIPSVDEYSLDLAQWIARQHVEHVAAMRHYDHYHAACAKQHDANAMTERLDELNGYVMGLLQIPDYANARANTENVIAMKSSHAIAGGPLIQGKQPFDWLGLEVDGYGMNILSQIQLQISAAINQQAIYSEKLETLCANPNLNEAQRKELLIATHDYAIGMNRIIIPLEEMIDRAKEALEGYVVENEHLMHDPDVSERQKMSVLLAIYCSEKVYPELSAIAGQIQENAFIKMTETQTLARLGPEVSVLAPTVKWDHDVDTPQQMPSKEELEKEGVVTYEELERRRAQKQTGTGSEIS